MLRRGEWALLIFLGPLLACWYFYFNLFLFHAPLPSLGDQLQRFCIAVLLPVLTLGVLGAAAERARPYAAWLSLAILGFGLSLLEGAVLMLLGLRDPHVSPWPWLAAGLVLLAAAWLWQRSFYRIWHLAALLAMILLHGVLNHYHSFLHGRPWAPWPGHTQTVQSPDQPVSLNPPLEDGHVYQFALLPHEGDVVEVRLVVRPEGNADLFLRMASRLNQPRAIAVDEYSGRLDRDQVTWFLGELEKADFWTLSQDQLGSMGLHGSYWHFQGHRDGRVQTLTCWTPLRPGDPPAVAERKQTLYELGLTFLRLAKAPYSKQYLR